MSSLDAAFEIFVGRLRADDGRVAVQSDGVPERVRPAARDQLGLLDPSRAAAHKNIGRAAAFAANKGRVPAQRHAVSEEFVKLTVARSQLVLQQEWAPAA